MTEKPSLGDLELEVLQYIAEHRPMSVRDIAARFGETHGLARTTPLKVMERLRKKGYLSRSREEGIFRYSAREASSAVIRGLIGQFIRKTLRGSVSPFVAYLSEAGDLSDEEVATLRRLVEKMESDRRKSRDRE